MTKDEKETGRRDTISQVSGPLRVIFTSWSLKGITNTPPGCTYIQTHLVNSYEHNLSSVNINSFYTMLSSLILQHLFILSLSFTHVHSLHKLLLITCSNLDQVSHFTHSSTSQYSPFAVVLRSISTHYTTAPGTVKFKIMEN